MECFLATSLLLLLQGGATSAIPRSEFQLRGNKPPVLQRIVLSDVSNIQLNNGRHSYFGAAPELLGTSDVITQNQEDIKSTMGTGKTFTRSTTADNSQSTEKRAIQTSQNSAEPLLPTVVSIRKQFPTSSDDQAGHDVQFAVNPGMSKTSLLNEASANSLETSLGGGVTDLNITTFGGEKINVTDALSFAETTTVRSSNVSNDNDSILQPTEKSKTTTYETESPPPDTANKTDVISQTTTENSTSLPTQCPTCNSCTDNPGLIAGMVVMAMSLVVLILMLLSLHCKRILLTFGSMCRCTKYTLV